ncbi:MAG: glycosyltransferase family 39 protein [Anaerolineae bacterium]|nr:glycosyltransferase family 39 protein [Anaerolineae bacterium]
MSFALESWRPARWTNVGAIALILVLAAFFRFAQLDTVPPGMTHDEAAFGAEAEAILAGNRPIYFALGYGHEPAYAYGVAAAFMLLGRTLTAMRVTSALCGLLVVLGTYGVARRMFGVRVAWVSAAWMAVALWPVSLSRQALRAITLPMLWLPAAWCFWRGLHAAGWRPDAGAPPPTVVDPAPTGPAAGAGLRGTPRAVLYFALAGLFLGASAYTYMASRVTWIVFPAYALYLLLFKEGRALLRRVWPGILVMLAVAALVVLPLALYLRAYPESEIRVGLMMEPVRELLAGRPQRALRHASNALRVFSWEGDRFWAYNIPGRAVFDAVGSALFYGGLGIALWRWRDPRHAFLLLWLLVGMLPAMVTTNEGIFLRAIVAQPATYVLVALALDALGRALGRLAARSGAPSRAAWVPAAWVALAVGLVAMEGTRTARSYFSDWPARPEARNIYNHNLVAAARYLRDEPEGGAVGISALYPLYYHDPWILRYVAGRDDLQVRWFKGLESGAAGGGGIVYPGQGGMRYVFSALTPLDPALRSEFERGAALIERRDLHPEDQNSAFEVWRWQGGDGWRAHLDALEAASPLWVSPEVRFNSPDLRRTLDGPAQFGDVMALVGYRWEEGNLRPGGEVALVTYWRALRAVEGQDDWNTFVHLLDADSRVIGGVDVLHCPPTGWLPGDVAVQVHRFTVSADALPGGAYLEVGVYRHSAGRSPVIVDGQADGDRVLLAPVEVG